MVVSENILDLAGHDALGSARRTEAAHPTAIALTPLLLTASQVRLLVNISEREIRARVSAGRFPKPVKQLGRMKRWKRTDVEAWVASVS